MNQPTKPPDVVSATSRHLINNQLVEVLHSQVYADNCHHTVTASLH